MVDIDGEVVEACKQHLPEMHQGAFDDPRTDLVIGDALEYLDGTAASWDVIISDLSDPIEEGPSFKLFTKEYFAQAKRALAPGGVFVVQAGPVAPAELRLHARIVNTLQTVWPQVVSYSSYVSTYASPWGFALASDAPIDTRPEPEAVDEILAKRIEDETEVYTLERPPKFFGEGISGN